MKAGVPIIAAHMFVYFYAILSVITPPVCLAAFAGAAIAETNAMKTGVTAMKLGIVAFIIPFMFVFEPALLMQGSTTEIATAFASALIGVIGIASGMQNWLLVRCRLWERALLLASGSCSSSPASSRIPSAFPAPYSLVRTAPQKGRFPHRGRLTVPE